MLNEFYRAHAGHLLINCEGDSESAERRFARVGSFSYGAYGNPPSGRFCLEGLSGGAKHGASWAGGLP